MAITEEYYWKRRGRRFFFFFILAGLFAFAAIVMLLWNAILPDLLRVSPINYWQSLGLLVLCRILFGGFRFGSHHRGRPPFANRGFREKFMNMTEEERDTFNREWKERCKK